MLSLENGATLYHGSYCEVGSIDLRLCLPGKDFGKGFYLTSSLEQARSFSLLSARRHVSGADQTDKQWTGHVSAFEFSWLPGLRLETFEQADEQWLHFVASNRRSTLFPEIQEQYKETDIIAGKIANDQTARTLQLYVSGAYGKPGTKQADSIAIATLLPNRLDNQFCFRTEKAIGALRFIGSEVCHDL